MKGTVGCLLLSKGRYVLQLRDNDYRINMPNTWAIFGGMQEPGESEEETCRREIQEETGILLTQVEFLGVFDEVPIFVSDISGKEISLKEGQAYGYFTLVELKEITNMCRTSLKAVDEYEIRHPRP